MESLLRRSAVVLLDLAPEVPEHPKLPRGEDVPLNAGQGPVASEPPPLGNLSTLLAREVGKCSLRGRLPILCNDEARIRADNDVPVPRSSGCIVGPELAQHA